MPTSAGATIPRAPERRGWWARWSDPQGRRAKREYRRSLPTLYRWRRVIVGAGVVAVAALVLGVTGNNPVAFVRDRWRDLTVQPVALDAVTAHAQGYVEPGYHVDRLPGSGSGAAWATTWPGQAKASATCGSSPAAGQIVLSWKPATRVRGLNVWAGLADGPGRDNQFRPRRLDVTYGADGCQELQLEDRADGQKLTFDTKTPVTTLVISIGDVFGKRATPPKDLVAIGGIEVLHRPE